jgi:hypothetical protein
MGSFFHFKLSLLSIYSLIHLPSPCMIQKSHPLNLKEGTGKVKELAVV